MRINPVKIPIYRFVMLILFVVVITWNVIEHDDFWQGFITALFIGFAIDEIAWLLEWYWRRKAEKTWNK
jgi:hypothetical protein